MNRPHKAFILAAGYGERLLPLTLFRPKPLVPAWNKPILRHVIEMFARWGVRDILVNTHYHAGQIVDYLRNHSTPGIRIQLSFEPEILGTGGALPRARWFLDDQPFWMMNADVLADVSPAPFLNAFRHAHPLAALWLHPHRGPRTVEHHRGCISCFRSRHPGAPGTCTFCGLHLVSPRILKYLPTTGPSSIIEGYERAMRAGEHIAAVVTPKAYWADIGTPAAYLSAHSEILECAASRKPGARLFRSPGASTALPHSSPRSFVSSAGSASLSPSARLHNVVIWDHAVIGPHADIRDAIISDHAVVNRPLSYMAIPADSLPDPQLHTAIRQLGWSPRNTLLNPLPPRGSARSFTRLISKRKSAILIRYGTERPENALYTTQARFLHAHGIRVPRIHLDQPASNLCIMEDAGAVSIESSRATLSPLRLRAVYRLVLDQVIRLHGPVTRAALRQKLKLSPGFDRALFLWEHDLFCTQFLRNHCGLSDSAITAARAELETLIPVLLSAPRVLLHRDLQSSNILLVRGKPVLIDFQGMRFGPAMYDLASLLCDPYVNLPPPLAEALLDDYVSRIPNGEQRRDEFPVAAAQRLAQALGAFGRLGHTPATSGFLRHIPAGVRQFLNAASRTHLLPVLCRNLVEWAERTGISRCGSRVS